ncbi:MAG: ABC transporter substrate-binding protein [Chloroflexota bacterium]
MDASYAERAAELVALRPDVLVASGARSAVALAQAATTGGTGSIPVAFVNVGAPVELGLVQSVARPGQNVTGLSSSSPELARKRLELLTDAVPGVSRPAALFNPANADDRAELVTLQAAGTRRGLVLRPIEVHAPDDVILSVEQAIRDGADAIILTSRFASGYAATTALQKRVPAVGTAASLARSNGALLSYGPDVTDMHRRAAALVDKILKGTSAGSLPVEQPSTFELVVNLKTAEALGLTIPRSVLSQATEIVQ